MALSSDSLIQTIALFNENGKESTGKVDRVCLVAVLREIDTANFSDEDNMNNLLKEFDAELRNKYEYKALLTWMWDADTKATEAPKEDAPKEEVPKEQAAKEEAPK